MNDYNNFSESYSNPRVKKLRSFAQSTYGMEAASYKGMTCKDHRRQCGEYRNILHLSYLLTQWTRYTAER